MKKLNRIDLEPQTIETPKRKKPYNKPSFRFESVFETRALSCGKIDTTQMACKLIQKS
jgi:hypothetical protein